MDDIGSGWKCRNPECGGGEWPPTFPHCPMCGVRNVPGDHFNAVEAVDVFVPLIRMSVAYLYSKHGNLTDDPVRATAIMMREVAEVMDDALLLTRRGSVVMSEAVADQYTTHMGMEILQVIAVGIYMLCNTFAGKTDDLSAMLEAMTVSDKVN